MLVTLMAGLGFFSTILYLDQELYLSVKNNGPLKEALINELWHKLV